jgi:hypothetical protein
LLQADFVRKNCGFQNSLPGTSRYAGIQTATRIAGKSKDGCSYRVKLWPTMVLLRDGQEVARLVRPTQTSDISAALKIE